MLAAVAASSSLDDQLPGVMLLTANVTRSAPLRLSADASDILEGEEEAE